MAHNRILRIFQDAKDFIWLATGEGLSRFDGYKFTNYGKADGLGNDFVNEIAVDRRGHLWAATNGGVSRLIDEPSEAENQSAKREKFVSFLVADGGENDKFNWG